MTGSLSGVRLASSGNAAGITEHWHRWRLSQSERIPQDWLAAEFHARRLTELRAVDAAAQPDLERILFRRPPPRETTTKNGGTRAIRLFQRTWENPAPEVEVIKLDFVAEHSTAFPFLVALTAE